MKIKDFQVGKQYRYDDIFKNNEDENGHSNLEINDYGPDYLGKNAIHIRFIKEEIDVWFVYKAQLNIGIFECVFNA